MTPRILLLFTLVLSAGAFALRLFPHVPNFTPVGALSLFVGVYLVRPYKWALAIPLGVMFLSDLAIGFYDAKLMAVVYGSFLFYVLVGSVFSKKRNILTGILGSFAGALFFFLSTNLAVWLFAEWYPKTLEGLLLCYSFAIPFFRYTLLGDLAYTLLFFGAFVFAEKYLIKYAPTKAAVVENKNIA